MSWDVFVQDFPAVATVEEIPDDFEPAPLGPRADVVSIIRAAAPQVDFTDPSWGRIAGPGYSIEVNVGDEDPVDGFAFHVRGGDDAVGIIFAVLERGGWRAVASGEFLDQDSAMAKLGEWRSYRDSVLGPTD